MITYKLIPKLHAATTSAVTLIRSNVSREAFAEMLSTEKISWKTINNTRGYKVPQYFKNIFNFTQKKSINFYFNSIVKINFVKPFVNINS